MTRKTIRCAFLTRASLAVLLGSVSLIVWQAPTFAQTCSCPPGAGGAPGVVIRADEPPPPLPEYDQPPMPAPGYIWTPGYWAWNNYAYYWVPGTWVEPPHPGLLWTPGYWGFVDGVYAFHRGYWGERVGFYGGVDYGFGYDGHGYEGGRWDNGRFFYNRVVNNFGNVHVTNVYEKNIVINNNNTRISFNGGKGGIEARPTPAEEAAAREQHVAPTRTQVEHARTASMDGALFQSNNHGKPAIANAAPRRVQRTGGDAREGRRPDHTRQYAAKVEARRRGSSTWFGTGAASARRRGSGAAGGGTHHARTRAQCRAGLARTERARGPACAGARRRTRSARTPDGSAGTRGNAAWPGWRASTHGSACRAAAGRSSTHGETTGDAT